jgi:hypothetical protein
MIGEKHMGGKFIGVRGVDPQVWQRFKAVVVARYGKLNRVMGIALTAAGDPLPPKQRHTHTKMQRQSRILTTLSSIYYI